MLRSTVVLLPLLVLTGCEATYVGALREPDALAEPEVIVFTPSPDRQPVDVSEEDFKAFMREMGVRITVENFKALMEELGAHHRTTSAPHTGRVVFASWEPPADGGSDQAVRDYLRWCKTQDRCIDLPGDGRVLGLEARKAIALNIALHSVWPSVVDAVGGMLNVHQLEVMVVTSLVVYLGLLVAPEPVTKLIAAKMTYILLGYVGVTTLWHLLDAWTQLGQDVAAARTFDEVHAAGARFGGAIGDQIARVLVTLVTWALGSKLDGSMPTLKIGGGFGRAAPAAAAPGAANAARMLVTEARGAATVPPMQALRSVTLRGGRVTFAFSSGAAVAAEEAAIRRKREKESEPEKRRPQQRPSPGNATTRTPVVPQSKQDEEQDDGNWHHIATNKNTDAEVRGGPWTPRFQLIFDKAGMSLNDSANLVWVPGHRGPHPEAYHKEVWRQLDAATQDCNSVRHCSASLSAQLRSLAMEISTPGTELNRLVTKAITQQTE